MAEHKRVVWIDNRDESYTVVKYPGRELPYTVFCKQSVIYFARNMEEAKSAIATAIRRELL